MSEREAAETGPFGTGGGEGGGGGSAEGPADTSQDDRPSQSPGAREGTGTAYKAPHLDRPAPGDEPLKVRFGKDG